MIELVLWAAAAVVAAVGCGSVIAGGWRTMKTRLGMKWRRRFALYNRGRRRAFGNVVGG